MTDQSDPAQDSAEAPDDGPLTDEPAEALAQQIPDRAPTGNWGWRAVVALAVGAGLVATGVWISNNFGGDEFAIQDQATRIDALEIERASLRAALTAAEADREALTQRLDAVDQTLAAVTDVLGGVTAAADFDVLATDVETRLGALENTQTDPAIQADNAAALADLSDRLDGLQALATRIAVMETFAQDVGALAEAGPGDGGVVPPNPALTTRLAELEQEIRALDAALAAVVETIPDEGDLAPPVDLSAIEARVAAVEETVRSLGPVAASRGSASALVLAAGQLRDRLLGQGPFRVELDTLRQVAQARQLVDRDLQSAMNRLGDLAADGVVTVETLTREFAGLAAQIVTATEPDEGWVADLWGRVRGVVSVRRTGDIEGDTIQAIVARAEVRLGDRDVTGAVAELESLDGAAAEIVKPWLILAQARAMADEAAALIATRAVALLAQEFGATQIGATP
jgi:hypothetical protein